MEASRPKPVVRFSLRWLLAMVTAASLFLAWFWAAFQSAHDAAQKYKEANNFKQVGLAISNFHDVYGYFPDSASPRSSGEPGVRWRMKIAPYLESAPYYVQYRYNEPWNGPANSSTCDFKHSIYCYLCAPQSSRFAQIVMPTGPGTIGEKPATLDDITDPHDQTILVMTLQHSDILWHEPRDLSIREITRAPHNPDRILIRGQPLKGGYCEFIDGSVTRLPADLKYDTLIAMLTIAGGEPIDMAWRDPF
jgi:hypothetical protein